MSTLFEYIMSDLLTESSEEVLDRLVIAFNDDKSKYSTATEKLNSVKKDLADNGDDEVMRVTPSEFFNHRKTNPSPKSVPKPEPVSDKDSRVSRTHMDSIVNGFRLSRTKFRNASQKFVYQRDKVSTSQPEQSVKDGINSITPKMFFDYMKGETYMVYEPETMALPKVPKLNDSEIQYTIDDTGTFTPLDKQTIKDYTEESILQYYKNTYHRSMSTQALAKHLATTMYDATDLSVHEIVKMLMDVPLDDSVTPRLSDKKIIEKAINHFGFDSENDVRTAMGSEYKDDVDAWLDKARESFNQFRSTMKYNHKKNDYANIALKQFSIIASKMQDGLLDAYFKRDATKLETFAKKLQIIKLMIDKEHSNSTYM